MLTRWHLLLGSTLVLGALLLVGCGGHNNSVSTGPSDEGGPSRLLGNAQVSFAANPHPTVTVTDDDGIKSIQLQWLTTNYQSGRKFFYPGGATTYQFVLPNWGQVLYYTFAVVDSSGMRDSRWAITSNGNVIRVR